MTVPGPAKRSGESAEEAWRDVLPQPFAGYLAGYEESSLVSTEAYRKTAEASPDNCHGFVNCEWGGSGLTKISMRRFSVTSWARCPVTPEGIGLGEMGRADTAQAGGVLVRQQPLPSARP